MRITKIEKISRKPDNWTDIYIYNIMNKETDRIQQICELRLRDEVMIFFFKKSMKLLKFQGKES